MLFSMTGFGKATCNYKNKKIVIEIKSLNSKQLDISTRIVGLYREKDIEIRNLIAQNLERGKIDLSLYIEDNNSQTTTFLNQNIISNYKEQIENTCNTLNIPVPANLMEIILRLPDSLKTESTILEEEEWNAVKELLQEAFSQINNFRKQEGLSLQNMFVSKINNIKKLLDEVEYYEKERVEKIRVRLEENLKSIEDKISIDRNRLEQEMIYYIEKLDVNEEKVRLRNHMNYFIETMQKDEAPGKKLGFIAQEMGREINTLGSKSNHSEMQMLVGKMKDELEQIKEQVLNVL